MTFKEWYIENLIDCELDEIIFDDDLRKKAIVKLLSDCWEQAKAASYKEKI